MERRDRCKWRQKDGQASISHDGELHIVLPRAQQAPQPRPILLEMRRIPLQVYRGVMRNGITSCRYRQISHHIGINNLLFCDIQDAQLLLR